MKELNFDVVRHPLLSIDLQEAIDYYNDKKTFLGNEFYELALSQLKTLSKDALLYQIRYEDVRCLQIPRFPFMIHYSIEFELNTIYVHGVINTHKDPKLNWKKRNF